VFGQQIKKADLSQSWI